MRGSAVADLCLLGNLSRGSDRAFLSHVRFCRGDAGDGAEEDSGLGAGSDVADLHMLRLSDGLEPGGQVTSERWRAVRGGCEGSRRAQGGQAVHLQQTPSVAALACSWFHVAFR